MALTDEDREEIKQVIRETVAEEVRKMFAPSTTFSGIVCGFQGSDEAILESLEIKSTLAGE